MELPKEFEFLTKPCKCQRRRCFQQFAQDYARIEAKRLEFQNLAAHEKDMACWSFEIR